MAKIKKIKLGETTYDLCDADAIHAVKQDGISGDTANRFGTCSTAASTATKTVSITSGTFSLEAGARVTVKFSNANTAGTPTLNVNSKGAKNIFHKGSQITTGTNKSLLAGTVDFVYDGTQWHLIGNYVNNSHAIISGTKKDTSTNIQGSASTGNITLGDSGVSQGYYGPENNVTGTSGSTFEVPEIAVNTKGIVTDAATRTITLPTETSVSIVDKKSNNEEKDTADLVYAVSNLVEGGTRGHTITPTYTGLPTKAYVDKIATGHVKYLGTVSALTGLSATAGQGDFYRVSTAFAFGSETAHVGDILLATKDNPSRSTTDWDLIHTEVDTNSWVANTKTAAGYVAAPTANNPTKVWRTDADGNPAWQEPVVKDSYISWGGQAITGGVTPVGMSLSEEHSGNKAAFINGDAITIEYSTDGGTTYTDSGISKLNKSELFTRGFGVPIGGSTAMTADNYTKLKTRITLTAQNGTGTQYIYTDVKKLLVNMSSAAQADMLIETMLGSSTTWSTYGTYRVAGWSGWNDIPLNITLGGGVDQKDRPWKVRFTFSLATYSTSHTTTKHIYSFRLFGQNSWWVPSTLGKTGHLYDYDMNQNATFPGDVTVATGKKFIGNLTGNVTGNADSATTLTGLTATVAELNYVDGVTSKVQTQLNSKLNLSGGQMTGDLKFSAPNVDRYIWFNHSDTNARWRTGVEGSGSGNANYFVIESDKNTTDGPFTKALQIGMEDLTATFGGKVTSSEFVGKLTGNADTATNVAWSGVTSKPSYYDAKAIKGIVREDGSTTFTYTCMDNTTGTFTQQDKKVATFADNTADTSYQMLFTKQSSDDQTGDVAYKNSRIKIYPFRSDYYADEYNGQCYNKSGTKMLIGDDEYHSWMETYGDEENGYYDDYADNSSDNAGTGHLEVTGNLIVGGGSDQYGIFPARSNCSMIGSSDRPWYTIYGTNIYQNGSQVITSIKEDGITAAKLVGGSATIIRYGSCSTAADTAAKTVSITSGTFALGVGARVTVKFTYANTASTPTLNVNSKGAKNIFHKGTQITTGTNKSLLAGVCDFVYDGTQWHLVGNYIDTNTNTNYYHTTGSWSGLTYTATANGGAGALAFTLPTGTTSTTVATGNHTHICSIKNSSGTAVASLAHGTTYTLTAGDTSVNFTMPSQYSHPTTAGNKHIPSGGSATKMLKYSSSGTVTWDYIANVVYPVGSIYMSVTNTSPATLFGGTWVQLKDRFLLGAGDTYNNAATGGSATHTLTKSELPNVQLGLSVAADRSGYAGTLLISSEQGNYKSKFASGSALKAPEVSLGTSYSTSNIKTEPLGGGKAHDNMPPYLVVYMWKRTA